MNIFVLFKSLNTVISVDELPHTVNLFNMNIILIFFHLDTKDVTLADGLPLDAVFHTICDELLLFIAVNVTAILPGQDNFYLFDSHSRDDRGLYVSDGTPVLLRLATF